MTTEAKPRSGAEEQRSAPAVKPKWLLLGLGALLVLLPFLVLRLFDTAGRGWLVGTLGRQSMSSVSLGYLLRAIAFGIFAVLGFVLVKLATRRSKTGRAILGMSLVYAVAVCGLTPLRSGLSRDELAAGATLIASPNGLKRTVVTPHLDAPITKGQNLLWCATAQIAWNELRALAGGDVQVRGSCPAVDALNKQAVKREDLDEDSFVAVAGLVEDGVLKTLHEEVRRKFRGAAQPRLLPELESLGASWIAYSCLFKELPFEWAFERLPSLDFSGTSVEAFGISQYLKCQENERRAAQQLLIYSFRNEDDFIIELKTRAQGHQLILAKVPPQGTLGELASSIRERLRDSKPETLEECNSLAVPVLNFDITHDFGELIGLVLVSANTRLNGRPIACARQNVRFRLDETGAVLKSEAYNADGIGTDLIFNKPFLVMLKKRGCEVPYLALWVDNPELLVPSAPPRPRR